MVISHQWLIRVIAIHPTSPHSPLPTSLGTNSAHSRLTICGIVRSLHRGQGVWSMLPGIPKALSA